MGFPDFAGNTIASLFDYSNTVTLGWFGIVMLITLYISTTWLYRKNGFSESTLMAGFVTMLSSFFLVVARIVDERTVAVFVGLTVLASILGDYFFRD